MTRVLLTGGAGYIGSHATRRLIDQGHEVVVVDDLSHGYMQAVDPRATFYKLNTGETESLTNVMQLHQIEAVMHFAALIEVGESMLQPARYYQNNVVCTLSLLAAMQAASVKRLVFSSTAAVYGNPETVPIDEQHRCAPINPYGRTKYFVEQILDDYASAYGLSYVVLRYFNVAGAAAGGGLGEAHEPESHLIPRILGVALNKSGSVSIFGTDYPTNDGTCIRDYVHVTDLADAHLLALNKTKSGNGGTVYNLGSESGFSVREVIDACAKVTGQDMPITENSRRPGDPPILLASSQKIKLELGWLPQYTELHTIIETAWQWHRTHPNGWSRRAST